LTAIGTVLLIFSCCGL